MSAPTQEPHITSITDLPTSEAKWAALKKIAYTDDTGKSRLWEMATRKTRGSAGVDAVAIGNIIFPPPSSLDSDPFTILVIQYRPPLDSYTIEWPAGLVDASESVETAAARELHEETGFEATKILSTSPIVAADPGLTNANMQLVMAEVRLKDGDSLEPQQRLDDGESIRRVRVKVKDLYRALVEFSEGTRDGENGRKFVVAAKLYHWAAGVEFARCNEYVR